MSNRARRAETRALRRRLLPDQDTIMLRLRLEGCRRPPIFIPPEGMTRAEFAAHLVKEAKITRPMMVAAGARKVQPIRTGRLR